MLFMLSLDTKFKTKMVANWCKIEEMLVKKHCEMSSICFSDSIFGIIDTAMTWLSCICPTRLWWLSGCAHLKLCCVPEFV